MHIIKDENGNVCPHGHEHSHEHGHAHTHDGVCQEGCSGCESHDPKKENIALLTYMLQHNIMQQNWIRWQTNCGKPEWIQRRNRYGKRLMNSRKATCI